MSILLRRLLATSSSQHSCIQQHKLVPYWRQLATAPVSEANKIQSKHKTELKISTEEWITIYRLPLARLAAAFNRLKIYQGALTVLGTPITFALEQAGQVGPNTGAVVGAIGLSGFLTLTLASAFVQNLIGFVYINVSGEKLKLAYVDFWGRRQELTVDIDDVAPVLEQNRFNFYQSIRLHSDEKRKFKLIQKFGIIQEPHAFAAIFGE